MDDGLRVTVIGRVELNLDGRPLVELASAKAVALLCYLALTGRAHARSSLAGLLWSDLPEASARANLRVVLGKLRQVLPDHLDVTRQTVALAADRAIWVDALEVARVAAAGAVGDDADGDGDAGADGDGDGDELMAAVRLCRGDLLEGFAIQGAPLFDEWLSGRRAALRAEMLSLMDRAVERARAQRDAVTGIEVARRILGLERLHEEAHRALMWFLATGGQRSAALAQYDTCSYLLREDLGLEPSAATVALRDEIASAGGFTGLGGPATAADRPANSAREPDLPRPLTALVGREDELSRLGALLDDAACRLVTLVGPGGIGKTRLAVEVAGARRSRYRDGTVFVPFVGTGPAPPGEASDLFVVALARALGVPLAVPRDPLDLLADHLADRDRLLVLDNLEHLPGAADVIAGLLRRAPGLQVLATSRRPLGLGVEWLLEVPGLPYPPPGSHRDAAEYAAVQLFEARARLLRPGFRAEADAEAAARLCRLVGGVPLAIELAARWVRSAGPAAIADRLASGLDLLETTSPDVEERHRSLRSVIDWSHRLLTDEERRALRRLSVLRHSFDLPAAAAVAGAGLPLLAALVDHSLVAAGDDGRYTMHETLRQYAAERLAVDPAEEAQTRRRHAEYYAALLPAPTPAPSDDATSPNADADADAENVRAATLWLIGDADAATLDAHLVRLWGLYGRLGWFREARTFFEAALERPDPAPLQRARWHRLLGEAHQQLGAAHAARHHLERALELLGGRVPTSTSGWSVVLTAQVTRRVLRRATRRLRPGGLVERRADRREAACERAAAGFTINEVYWVLEEHFAMLPTSIRALSDAERGGDVDLAVRALAGVGMTVGTVGLRGLARRQLSAARAAAERTDDPLTSCWVAILGSLHAMGVGDWTAVDTAAARALELQRRRPTHRLADQVLLIDAAARYLTSRYEETSTAAAQGMASGRDRSDPVVHLWGLIILIETALRSAPDDPALAAWFSEAERLVPQAATIDAARLRAAAARSHLAAGQPAEAWQAIRVADRLIGPRPSFVPYALEALAGVPEVCLALTELEVADPVEVRAAADAGLRRLRRYARTFPMARPRALVCSGRADWAAGRPRAARRAWVRAVREAERLQMPYEVAGAHLELGRHLGDGERSALGLDGPAHLRQATTAYRYPIP